MNQARPLLYLTTAGAVTAVRTGKARPETRAAVGDGPVYSIMRVPRPAYGEAAEGRVISLCPTRALLEQVRAARQAATSPEEEAAAWATYEAELLKLWRPALLPPGRLTFARPVQHLEGDARRWDGENWRPLGPVPAGATLICSCGVADARAGRCHRVVAARLLAQYGWRVVLDGQEIGT